jgi:hypothetical protein
MALIKLNDEQKVTLTIDPRTASNNPADVESINWTNSNEGVATLVVSDDKKSATVLSVGIGATQIGITVDSDLSENVTELSGFVDIEVVASQAVSLGINAGVPELK